MNLLTFPEAKLEAHAVTLAAKGRVAEPQLRSVIGEWVKQVVLPVSVCDISVLQPLITASASTSLQDNNRAGDQPVSHWRSLDLSGLSVWL